MNITRLAIEKDRITYAVIVMLTLAGMLSYVSLPKNQDPGFTIRVAVVSTRFKGASALRVEQLVTDRVEQKVQEMPELDKVTSISMNGMSVVYAEFKDRYTDMRPIFDDLRRKVV
ncbi:MAG: efflux RND transporter permease subunit, partial [Gammaproteobacteria bacterium]